MNPLQGFHQFQQRAGTLLLLRLLLAGTGILVYALQDWLTQGRRPIPDTTDQLVYLLLAATALLNMPYLFLRNALGRLSLYYHLQIALDLVMVSALVYLTGGAGSVFIPFYVASILSACFFISPSGGFVYASVATISLSAVTVLYHLHANRVVGFLPFIDLRMSRAYSSPAAYGDLALQVVAFYLLAILTGRLAAGHYRVRALNEVILENLAEGVVVVDAGGNILFANPEAQRMLEIPGSASMVGRPVAGFLRPEEAMDLQEVLGGRGTRRREVARGSDEAALYCQTTCRPLSDRGGDLFGVLIVMADLTPRKRMEEMARRVDRVGSLEELAAGIAHEVRTPLTSIRGCAQELERSFEAQGKDARLLSLLVREADRLNKIVGGVLDFARPLRIRPSPCRLVDVLSDVRLVLQRIAAPGQALEIRGAGDLVARADPDLLKQVFLNLGANAFQAMDGKPGKLTIQARKGTLGFGATAVWVDFQDGGRGIAHEDLPNIFRPFFTTRPEGTGLGLAVAQRIVQAHGGEIRVRSEPGRGSVFSVGLPQAPSDGNLTAQEANGALVL